MPGHFLIFQNGNGTLYLFPPQDRLYFQHALWPFINFISPFKQKIIILCIFPTKSSPPSILMHGGPGPYPEVDAGGGGYSRGYTVTACSKLPRPSGGCSIYKLYIFLWHRGGVTDPPPIPLDTALVVPLHPGGPVH